MPEWLVKSTLRELDRIDKEHESGKISDSEHIKQSKKVIEKALSMEKNIALKYKCEDRNKEIEKTLGKLRQEERILGKLGK